MYQLISAIGKLRAVGSRWENIDISNLVLADLYSQYTQVYARLSNPFYTGERSLDLEDIRDEYQGSGMTFNAMLNSIGDGALPTTEELHTFETKWALYSDAFRARYKVQPVSPNGHLNSSIPMAERHWLALSKAGVDFNLFYKHCLVSVNGLYHLTDTDGEYGYVVDGMKSCRQSGRNEIGITSFLNIGELEFVPITEAMVHRRYADMALGSVTYLDVGTARPGKYAMLVLGGYLHVLDNETFYQVNDAIYAIDFQNFPLRERYFESKGLIDLSSFNLEVFNHNPDQTGEQELYSDETITKYCTLPQSFLVFVDNPNIFKEKVELRPTVLPNMYTSYVEPSYPLVTGAGKLGDYWKTKEHGQWAVNISNGIRHNYTFNTVQESTLVSYDDSSPPFAAVDLSHVYLLKIGTQLLV